VVLGEPFFYHERGRGGRTAAITQATIHLRHFRLHDIHIARNQFQLGIVIRSAGLIGQGDPALDVHGGFLPVQGKHVIGAPVQPFRQIGGFHLVVGAFIGQQPHQRGLGNQFFRYFREHDHAGVPQVNFVLNPIHRPVVHTEQGGRLLGELIIAVLVYQGNLAAHIFFHQFFRTYQVELIVLLENFQRSRIIDGAQTDRLGHNFRGHVHEPQGRFARQHFYGPAVAHQGAVVVVDRHRHIRLVLQRCLS